ncbi:P-loop containing nucleoside triphosphate hydrolase protein [Zychaea mexicana]|uniref:P-loop containing nucleoside triphosphate hydrolase protein n=1 Tax=Zychaea mexicana TaxID=64656 RepID=UPI0022FDBDF6|nr:P-loop containing nucleoside triphosphate hydrolase protein [Zychaea mexicana]KAI9498223.1 P-loop containing nucleoside triphosphate hydrolase protein [Zychaea mexicana]
MSTLSNRQRFNQIQPPQKLYEKLERLGFGSLRQTKRYAWKRNNKTAPAAAAAAQSAPKELEYKFPLLSFFAGAKTPASFPPEDLGEVAVVGRSNVGKSTLLNSLAATTVVRVSDKPGLTQQLNFFSVGKLFYMVDMPGYGFALVDEQERQQWRQLMESYIASRKTLKRVYLVIDARHGLKVADLDFLQMLDSKKVKFQIVMTKSDIPVLPTLARRIITVQEGIRGFRNAVQDVLVVSSKSGAGINQMRKEMLFLMGHLRNRKESNQTK